MENPEKTDSRPMRCFEGPINASKASLAVYKYNEAATLLDEATEAYKAAQSRFTAARNDLTVLFNPFIRTNS